MKLISPTLPKTIAATGEATKLIDEAIREVKEGSRWRNEHGK
jgi:hypothetical protein